MSSTLFRDVEVGGRIVDVHVTDGVVRTVGARRDAEAADEVIDGEGGALLPGLHDHHLHLMATAAAWSSVDVSGTDGMARLAHAPGPPSTWVRAVGYHESVPGQLTRHVLDAIAPDRPVRVQDRSGALWVVNSRALERIEGGLDHTSDVERDPDGRPNGRLWRYDERLRPLLPQDLPDLAIVGKQLAQLGITSVTDATPDLDAVAIDHLAEAHRSGRLPQGVTLLGATGSLPRGLRHGPFKVLLRDHDLPSYDTLRGRLERIHLSGRPVAVHCVTSESLILTIAVLDEIGRVPGDRIEHASVTPAPHLLRGLRVVTQPGFIAVRGDDYLRNVDPADIDGLYRFATLRDAGIDVVASSDAPYGPVSPWAIIEASMHRLTPSGVTLNAAERVGARQALAGYLEDAAGRRRRVRRGRPADLCLLTTGLECALTTLDDSVVRSAWIAGRCITS